MTHSGQKHGKYQSVLKLNSPFLDENFAIFLYTALHYGLIIIRCDSTRCVDIEQIC